MSINSNSLLCFMRGVTRALWRFMYFVSYTIYLITGYYFLVIFSRSKKLAAHRIRRRWLEHMPRQMGIEAITKGEPCRETCLFVANHISYLDPIVIWLKADARVVAKAEVLKWPLVGLAGYIVGTIFVNREDKSSRLETASVIREVLAAGTSVLVFPEGTTTNGEAVLPFRPRTFETAEMEGIPVQPINISYADPEAAFVDNDIFLPHFFKLFRLKTIRVKMEFGPLLEGPDTRRQAQEWIESKRLSLSMKPV